MEDQQGDVVLESPAVEVVMETEVRDSDVFVRSVVIPAEVVLAHADPDGAPVEASSAKRRGRQVVEEQRGIRAKGMVVSRQREGRSKTKLNKLQWILKEYTWLISC